MRIGVNNYPDFLIVGAAKSGTTSLHNYLKEHPQVVLPEELKETLFWHITTNPNKVQTKYLKKHINDLQDYLDLFKNTSENMICGEVTPSYLYYHKFVINNMKKNHPKWKDVKIIIILRESVSKVISHYHFVTNTLGIKDKSLKDALEKEPQRLKENNCLLDLFYIDSTLYYKQVKAYLENFNHVQILFFDDLVKNPQEVINKITDFLGVSQFKNYTNIGNKFNVSKRRLIPKNNAAKLLIRLKQKIPFRSKIKYLFQVDNIISKMYKEESVDISTKIKLKNIFFEDIKKLSELLNIDLITKWNY